MNKYNNSRIFKIVDKSNNDIYIGSTINSLEEALLSYKTGHNRKIKSREQDKKLQRELIKNLQIELRKNLQIELLEDVNCEGAFELRERLRFHIENNNCINKRIPNRTPKESCKAYRNKSKNKNKSKIIAYPSQNKEYKKLRRKQLVQYQNSWGGDKRSNHNNNLLQIDINIFK